ncbi:MAG TPA: ribosomal protein S18-alanine N-acetyltransferase [Pseudomonadales bacterium]|nr:ribosomal protein S18-alanine N-acetyltransferase [Pseudomonadales bacterium]
MRDADLDAVLSIEHRAYPYPWTEVIFRDCLRVGYSCWVAECSAGVIAYTVLSIAAGEAHLLNLCVDPSRQREGIGRRLLRHALRLAREHGADTLFLEVRPSNDAAVNLYRDAGFVEIGTRRDYYPARGLKREDALVLALPL